MDFEATNLNSGTEVNPPVVDVSADMEKVVKVETYKVGDEEKTRWGHWIITNVVYADPETKQIPIVCEKDITVEPGESLSAQAHFGRGEVYRGISGTTMVCIEGEVFELKAGDEVTIPRGALHFSWVEEFDENGNKASAAVFHEIQSGPLCAEKDIKRGADRQKLNMPHLLNPEKEDAGKSPQDVLLELRMKVAKDRYQKEVIQNGMRSCDYDRKVDFMPKVIDLLEAYPQGFSDPECISALENQFSTDIQAHIDLHKARTPELKPDVEQKIRAKLKAA